MKRISRRNFLKAMGISATALTLHKRTAHTPSGGLRAAKVKKK